jgi:hypothetical protein
MVKIKFIRGTSIKGKPFAAGDVAEVHEKYAIMCIGSGKAVIVSGKSPAKGLKETGDTDPRTEKSSKSSK